MIRVLGLTAAALVVLYAAVFLSIVSTGCTEPGTCAFPGELARDHGGKIVFGGALAVFAVSLARARSQS